MSNLVRRIAREPVAIGGFLVAFYGVLVAFHVLALSRGQIGALTILWGTGIALLRWLVTPAADVLAQLDAEGHMIAGQASPIATGAPVTVQITKTTPPVPRRRRRIRR